jgi:hypothetical protein
MERNDSSGMLSLDVKVGPIPQEMVGVVLTIIKRASRFHFEYQGQSQ